MCRIVLALFCGTIGAFAIGYALAIAGEPQMHWAMCTVMRLC